MENREKTMEEETEKTLNDGIVGAFESI